MAAPKDKKSCLLAQLWLCLTIFWSFAAAECKLEELTPSRILAEVEHRCVLVLSTEIANDADGDNLKTTAVAEELQRFFVGNKEIIFGVSDAILSPSFHWPDGQPLKWQGRDSRTNPVVKAGGTFKTPNLLVFTKKKKSMTCLLPGPIMNPKPELFIGPFTVEAILDWVNVKCNLYISATGGLTYQGMHRENILQHLFRMSHVSNFTMRDFNKWRRSRDSDHHLTRPNSNNHTLCAGDRIPMQCRCESYACIDEFIISHLQGYCSASLKEMDSCRTNLASDINELNSRGSRIADELPSQDSDQNHSFAGTAQMPQCDRLSALPSKGKFLHDYLMRSKPVILEGAAVHWDAFSKWTTEFLRDQYGGKKDVHIKLAPDGLFEGVEASSNWEDFETFAIPPDVQSKLMFPDLVVVRPATMNLKFSEFLDVIGAANESNRTKPRVSAYLEYSSIPNYLPELEQDLEEFPFVQGLLERQHLNIWLSDGNTLGKLHFDPFDNFLCQIRGTKQLTLFEPHENTKMYEAHIPEAMLGYDPHSGRFRRKKLLDSTAMVMAPVDILHPDFQRFPAFAEARPLNCTINEGDVLFMPAFWWHEVQSYPNLTERRNLAVNFWYEPFLTKEFPCPHCQLDVNPLYRHLL